MHNKLLSTRRYSYAVAFTGFILTAALLFSPGFFSSQAGGRQKGLIPRTESHTDGLENYDIRSDKKGFAKLVEFRRRSGRTAVDVADIREEFARSEGLLHRRVPTLRVEYNRQLQNPEVIAPDVRQGKGLLTAASNVKRAEILRGFARENAGLIGLNNSQADKLEVAADYSNPDGNLGFAHLRQEINGIPVFQGEIKAGFTKNGEVIRVINNLAPGLTYESISSDFGDVNSAVRSAAGYINHQLTDADVRRNDAASDDRKVKFGEDDWATTAEKLYFPTEPGVAVPAWKILIWEPVNAYYVIVDARDGTLLWRKNIGEDQAQSATYQVYTNPAAMINVADSPAPLTPGPITPGLGTQGAITSRTNVTIIGNEVPYNFNNNGWITDGANSTDGNNVEAGVDRVSPNGVDAPQTGNPARTFDSTWNPPPGNPAPGDDPLSAQAQRGAVIQMFYIMNRYHDELYRLGFTEQAFNFQNDNFGRGGAGLDRVSAEGQDSSGFNNANFNTPADGGRGRMQMYLWSGPTPDYDGTTDADVVIHEVTHGTSNRLHGNAAGLATNMSRGMGEGWSDFYAHAMLSEPSDPINGVYSLGGYATYLLSGVGAANYYYGIRRFPKAVMAFTGGPNNRPHNPLTFADIDATQMNLSDGAYAPAFSGTADQVHNAGEIWSSALWEVRAKFVTRLGWAAGNRKALQLITDGMKLAPIGPTFLQERDAIIAAGQASGLTVPEAAADVADIWAGFAIRGMGFSASIQNPGTGTGNARVTEAFDLPNLVQTPALTISDTAGNGNGFPEPGETIQVNIPLTNNTGNVAANTSVQIVGGSTVNYGNIANGTTVTNGITYTVPAGGACGASLNLTININSSLGPVSVVRTIILGVPVQALSENFDAVTAPGIPAGWTAATTLGSLNFATVTSSSDTAPNSVYVLDPTSGAGGADLTSPSIPIATMAATVSFRNKYDTEAAWDGGLLEISIGGGAFTDIIASGGSFIANGYSGLMTAATPTGTYTPSPLNGRMGWTGDSGGFVTSIVKLPAAAAGQNVRLKWRFGADDNTAGTGPNSGWYIDTVRVIGSYTCDASNPPNKTPFDFDGDGKTDVSIFRPAGGEWWYQKSSNGQVIAGVFGISTDIITPGDFTGDRKADIAFFRPSTGQWFILRSEDNSFLAFPFGQNGDVPAPADYDSDGKYDAAVFRPSSGTWFISQSGGGGTLISQFGTAGDQPAAADYDNDGKADIAIVRNNGGNKEWWVQRSTAGLFATAFGTAGDQAVQGDYTGDAKADIAVWRPATGQWFILRSEDFSFLAFPFGQPGDTPVPGDYDGDGRYDAGVFRPATATWFVNRSGGSGTLITAFGAVTDRPVPNAYVR